MKAIIGTLAVSAAVAGAALLAWSALNKWCSRSDYSDKSREPKENLKPEGTRKSSASSTSQSPPGGAAVAPLGRSSVSSSSAAVCDGRKLAKCELQADDGRGSRRNGGGSSLSEVHKSYCVAQAYSDGSCKRYTLQAFAQGMSRNPVSRVITMITYNVWQTDVKLYERMNAIGELLQKKLPDIILLQEVTPAIYKTFTHFNWWNEYACVQQPKSKTREHFCILLSKFGVTDFDWKPFKRSTMRSKLVVAEIDVKNKRRKLIVANSHLKRPDLPSETHSKKRIAQANEAISVLSNSPNVVLGGDMNWDEDLDGHFPLAAGWVDAWERLRPKEDGWTYDTESNPMIKGRRRLQKRLDRFVCKLKDFRMDHVDRIGMDEIPGVRHQYNVKEHPVLCSDHFGLLLTISIE